MKISRTQKVLAWILSCMLCITLIPDLSFAVSKAGGEAAKQQKIAPEDVTEKNAIESEKTEDTTTYALGGGEKMTVFHGGEVRYKNKKGKWIDNDPSLVKIKSGQDTSRGKSLDQYAYENSAGEKKQYMPQTLSESTPILMENEDYEISFSPKDKTMDAMGIDQSAVSIKNETIPSTYEGTEKLPISAVYGSKAKGAALTYTSGEYGVKETITLEEKPDSNVFQYSLKLKGMNARKNATDQGITYYDKKTGDIAGYISAPWMNDDTGNAYSDAITYDLQKNGGEQDAYTLTMTVNKKYLNDKSRKYPVTIDPSNTWQGSTEVKDAYLISGSTYGNTNFYDSGTKIMPAGKNTSGTHRTCIEFVKIKTTILDQSVSSAKMTLYETGTGASAQKIDARRLTEAWSPSTVTWNNRPAYGNIYDTITTKKTANAAHTFDMLAYAKGLANDSIPSYGIALVNSTTSPSYACFYGSRSTSSAYRPKLAVTYYSKPTTAASASIAPASVKASTSAKLTFSGITSTGLDRTEYRIDQVACPGTTQTAYCGYSSTTKIKSGDPLPTLPEGCYKFYVRGVNLAGVAGVGKGTNIVHVDKTPPTVTLTGPSTSAASPSGVKSPVIKWNVADTHLSHVTCSVNDGPFGGDIGATGNKAIADFTEQGENKITLKATDTLGNTATKTFMYYLDTNLPVIGNVQIKTTDNDKLDANWTKDANPQIQFDGIDDDMAISPTGIQYAICKEGESPRIADFQSVKFDAISATKPYKGSFYLNAADKSLPSGSYEIHLRAKDVAGNSVVKTLAYNKDNEQPTAKLKVMSHSGSSSITDVKNVVTVAADIDGTGSPVAKAKVDLYKLTKETGTDGKTDEKEEYIDTLIKDVTRSDVYEWDTTEEKNGTYRLKAEVEDTVGLKGQAVYNVKIVNPGKAPELSADPIKENPSKITWKFGADSSIKEVQYKLEGGADWVTAATPEEKNGQFDVELPKEGEYQIQVRGIDDSDVPTKTATVLCVYDTTKPTAELRVFDRGRITGTADDLHMDKWQIFCKKDGMEDSEYTEKLKGEKPVKNGELGILDFSDPYFDDAEKYTLKLVVTDKAGNVSETTLNIDKPDAGSSIKVHNPSFTIKRPVWDENNDSSIFTIGTLTKALELKTEKELPSSGKITWYIDNKVAGEGALLSNDFSVYKEGEAHPVIAIHTDQNGNRLYSRQMIENDVIQKISFPQETPASSAEKTVSVEKDVVSLRLIPEGQTASGVKYELKTDGGNYIEVEPGKTYPVSQFAQEAAYAGSFTIRVSAETETQFSPVSLQLDTVEKEAFRTNLLCNYIPDNASVKARLNDRSYLYWENQLTEDVDSSLSYNVYHSIEPDFQPSEKTLAAENVRAGYYSEINVNYGGNQYYRITVVKRDKNGNKIEESVPSGVFGGKNLDYNEHIKRLGLQDYWEYEDFNLPIGSGSVEKSNGNFVYQQTDVTLPNEKLDVNLTRTYNSQSSEKSAFGLGWRHNYDLQLLNVYDKDADSFDNVIFKDSSGTIMRFVKGNKENQYYSARGEYISMEKETKTEEVKIPERKTSESGQNQMKTVLVTSQYTIKNKDNTEYRFNGGGQLVYMTEPNGSFLLFEYQEDMGLLKKVTTNQNLAMDFTYNTTDPEEDLLVVEKITLPDGSKRAYQYDHINNGTASLLTKEINTGKDGETQVYDYTYDKSDNPNLTVLKDGKGQEYQVSYDKDKVAEVLYPNQEKKIFTYANYGSDETKTTVEKAIRGPLLLGDKKLSTTAGIFDKKEGYCLESTDANGNTTGYRYEDGVRVESTWKADSSYIAEDGTIKNASVTERKELTELGARRNAVAEVGEDGSTSTYAYHAQDDPVKQDQIAHEKTVDADGDIEAEHRYEYDAFGNEVSDYDQVEDRTTVSEYCDDEEISGELESETEYMGDPEEGKEIQTTKYTYAYDNEGNKTETETAISDGKKTVTTTCYDVMGNEISSTVQSGGADKTLGSSDIDSSSAVTYDGFGRAVKSTTTEGAITTVTTSDYDDNGTTVKETVLVSDGKKEDLTTTYYTYDEMNRLKSATVNDNGQEQTKTTNYAYEDVNVHSVAGEGKTVISNASVVTETDQDGYVLTETYQDKAGNTVKEKQDGLYTETLFDRFGKAVGTYNAGDNPDTEDGMLTLNLYDKNGNQTDTVINPESGDSGDFFVGKDTVVQSVKYSAAGKEVATTDGMGNTTSYDYDARGELSEVVLPDGSKTTYGKADLYVDGNLQTKTTTTDAKGQVSHTISNSSGEEIEIKDLYEEGGQDRSLWTQYTYDEKGNVEKETTAKGNYKQYHYNDNNQVTQTDYYEELGGNKELTLKTTYTYDVSGNVTTMCDYKVAEGKETLYRYTDYTYDKQKRLVSFAEVDGPDVPTGEELDKHKVAYTYNKDGKVTGVKYSFAENGVKGLTYHYDKNKWLSEITVDQGGWTEKTLRSYTYDQYGRVAQMEDSYGFASGGGSIIRTYDYDDLGRVTAMVYKDSRDPDQIKESYKYIYDKNNNITEERIVNNDAPEEGQGIDCVKAYTYDNVGRLTASNVTDLNGDEDAASGLTSYAYDAVGNRLKETAGDVTTTYDYNGLNQLTKSQEKKQAAEGATATSEKDYDYDRNGNLIGEADRITGESKIMGYDGANRLVRYAEKKDDLVVLTQENQYNGTDQRIQKKETKGQDAKTSNYYYQGTSPLYTTDEKGNRTSLNLMGLSDNVIATSRGTGSSEAWYLYNKDVRESTSSLVDETGTVAAAYAYDAFGNTEVRVGEDFDNEVAYTGQIWDRNTGLYYYNARYYNPEDGRFVSQDTYRGEQKEPGTWHLYTYCSNNPINYTDPSGHKVLKNRKIYLDAGHGGQNLGARKKYKGKTYKEEDLNLILINKYLRPKLKRAGAKVLRSRGRNRTMSNAARYKDANKRKAAIFVSVHHNSSEFFWKKGTTVLYSGKHHTRDSSRLARLINDQVANRTGFNRRSLIKDTEMAVLGGTKMPAVITETGYMSNDGDMNRILNKRNQVAEAIVSGIKSYFDVRISR